MVKVKLYYSSQITEGIKKKFETTIMFNYGNDIQRNSTNKLITDAWDSMQSSVSNYFRYVNSRRESKSRTKQNRLTNFLFCS